MICRSVNEGGGIPTVDNTKCIARVANKANISEKTKQAINLMNDVVKKSIAAGKDPGFAATILHASCIKTGEQKTRAQAEATIRNKYKDLKESTEIGIIILV